MPRVTRLELRDAICDALWNVKADDLAQECVRIGLAPRQEDENPYHSKKGYVRARINGMEIGELTTLGFRVLDEVIEDAVLREILNDLRSDGVSGPLRNIIFAADGPKPRIRFTDALNNTIAVVENEEFCLVYDQPLHSHGLTWRELVAWWAPRAGAGGDERQQGHALYRRLLRSVPEGPERTLFDRYCTRYGTVSFDIPALLPQVYLHYDPYTKAELGGRVQPMTHQRMDFLLLLPQAARVVIEIDGKHHYSEGNLASPGRYAEMVAEDRALRLAGYEVYRFGGQEFTPADRGTAVVDAFIDALLPRHGITGQPS